MAILFQFAFDPAQGMINGTLKAVGFDDVPDWLGDPKLALWVIMAVLVWCTTGFFVVLFSAGMASIPKDFYEAALLDGASRITTFFRITLPLLWDTVQSGWVYMGILALGAEGFAIVHIMSVGPGGPTTRPPSCRCTSTSRRSVTDRRATRPRSVSPCSS